MQDLFFVRFFISSLTLSLLTLIVVGLKKIFNKHITPKWQYRLWLVFLVVLAFPLIPKPNREEGEKRNWGIEKAIGNTEVSSSEVAQNQQDKYKTNLKGSFADYTSYVNYATRKNINWLCIGGWLLGIGIYLMRYYKVNRRLKIIRWTIKPIEDKVYKKLFEECKDKLNIKKNIIFGESHLIQTPMVFGIRRTYVVLPSRHLAQLSGEEISYILMHELMHYKRKDILMNYVLEGYRAIYWFNPVVHRALELLKGDREIACDDDVLQIIDQGRHVNYGKTILHFAEMMYHPIEGNMVTLTGESKSQLKKRIEAIVYFKKDTVLTKVKNISIFIIITALMMSKVSALSIVTYEGRLVNLPNSNIVYEDLSKYFGEIEGTFILYDLNKDSYRIYNEEKSRERVSPNSTYKIYSGLIGLETGVINEYDSVRKWDGKTYPYTTWNQDQDLSSAMKNSVNWYFEQVDEEVGRDILKYYFDKMHYGNKNLSGDLSSYWIESSLKIAPIEQVELLKKLYINQLPFEVDTMNKVKESLMIYETEKATLSGKTGSGHVEGEGKNGWFIGCVEKQGETYLFATYIEDKHKASGSLAAEITLNILKEVII